jgi:hypothetical protein
LVEGDVLGSGVGKYFRSLPPGERVEEVVKLLRGNHVHEALAVAIDLQNLSAVMHSAEQFSDVLAGLTDRDGFHAGAPFANFVTIVQSLRCHRRTIFRE